MILILSIIDKLVSCVGLTMLLIMFVYKKCKFNRIDYAVDYVYG